jgi:hypothetical protein
MEMDVTTLRATEAEAIRRLQEKARMLRAENPELSPSIARARAASALPATMAKYMEAVSRLQYMGQWPVQWK